MRPHKPLPDAIALFFTACPIVCAIVLLCNRDPMEPFSLLHGPMVLARKRLGEQLSTLDHPDYALPAFEIWMQPAPKSCHGRHHPQGS